MTSGWIVLFHKVAAPRFPRKGACNDCIF